MEKKVEETKGKGLFPEGSHLTKQLERMWGDSGKYGHPISELINLAMNLSARVDNLERKIKAVQKDVIFVGQTREESSANK